MTRCTCRFHGDCTVHDRDGKRWDAYSLDEIAAATRITFEPAPAADDWNCYCGRHDDTDCVLPPGTLCAWERTSSMYDEAECRCALSIRDEWLAAVTTDWDAEATREHRRWRARQAWWWIRNHVRDWLHSFRRRPT